MIASMSWAVAPNSFSRGEVRRDRPDGGSEVSLYVLRLRNIGYGIAGHVFPYGLYSALERCLIEVNQ